MVYVKSSPNEYLVVGRNGRVVNCGTAASVLLWPGSTCVRVPATKQEARFEMTQETLDGIPLRFKGIAIYRIKDPVATATMFDLSGPECEQIKTLIAHICLGELRATVAHLSMAQCIEQRKTTLTDAVRSALDAVITQRGGWGIELDVVQVAQVFIVDEELRRRLEAGVRNELASRSGRSEIQMREEIRLAQLASERRLEQEALESERNRSATELEKMQLANELASRTGSAEVQMKEEIRLAQFASERRLEQEALESARNKNAAEREKLRLARELQETAIEAEVPVKKLRFERSGELLQQELSVQRLENEVTALKVEGESIGDRARQALRKEILPLEQAPVIAEALSKAFQGTQLSVYGADAKCLEPISMLRDLLGTRMRGRDNNETQVAWPWP